MNSCSNQPTSDNGSKHSLPGPLTQAIREFRTASDNISTDPIEVDDNITNSYNDEDVHDADIIESSLPEFTEHSRIDTAVWGVLKGCDIEKNVNNAYEEVVKWRKKPFQSSNRSSRKRFY